MMFFSFRRATARIIDYLLWGMLVVAVLGEKMGDGHSPSWLFYVSFWGYVFVEAGMISLFGATVGKRFSGIRVYAPDGGRLPFFQSLKRSFLVFGAGMGLLLPYVSLVLPVYAFYRAVKRKKLFWDAETPSVTQFVKTTLTDKAAFSLFLVMLSVGYFLTVRVALIHQKPDFSVIEEDFITTYFDKIRPKTVEALSEESVSSRDAVIRTLASLRRIQKDIAAQRGELMMLKAQIQEKIDRMSVGELRQIRQEQADKFFSKVDGFLFTESVRVSLFENILEFFEALPESEYAFANGRPVFQNPETVKRYDNFMIQLQAFLSAPFD